MEDSGRGPDVAHGPPICNPCFKITRESQSQDSEKEACMELAFALLTTSHVITFSIQMEASYPLKNARTILHGGKINKDSIYLISVVTFTSMQE